VIHIFPTNYLLLLGAEFCDSPSTRIFIIYYFNFIYNIIGTIDRQGQYIFGPIRIHQFYPQARPDLVQNTWCKKSSRPTRHFFLWHYNGCTSNSTVDCCCGIRQFVYFSQTQWIFYKYSKSPVLSYIFIFK